MAFWNDIEYKNKPQLLRLGRGINSHIDPVMLEADEVQDSMNLCGDDYPIARTRNDRVLTTLPVIPNSSLGSAFGLGIRSTESLSRLLVVDSSGRLLYGSPTTAIAWTMASSTATIKARLTFVDFNTQTEKHTVIADASTSPNHYWDGTDLLPFADTHAPNSMLITSHKYRLYGIDEDGRTLRYTAQGDLTDWTPGTNDAGWIDITAIDGKATAITTFADHVIVWSNNSMHELYGSNPINFDLINISYNVGCVSARAFTECKGRLFWLDYSGIYLYTGGMPRMFGHKAKKYIEGINWDYKDLICAGTHEEKMYFAIPYTSHGSTAESTKITRMIVIDMQEGKGNVHTINTESGNFLDFVTLNEKTYGLRNDGVIQNMHSTHRTGYDEDRTTTNGSTARTIIPWYFETKLFSGEQDNRIALRDLFITHRGTGEFLFLYYTSEYPGNYTTFMDISAFTNSTQQSRHRAMAGLSQLQDNYHMSFEIHGQGYKEIKAVQLNIISYGDVI
jgi:hypothetical protein